MASPILEKFWNRVELVPFTTCWLWNGPVDKDGYGVISIGMQYLTYKARPCRAHRVSWELHFGEIPKGAQVLHSCDVPSCVNPSHLRLGTHADNMRDKTIRKRISGENSPTHKLSANDVDTIRAMLESGIDGETVARQFNITRQNVWCIKHRKTWL